MEFSCVLRGESKGEARLLIKGIGPLLEKRLLPWLCFTPSRQQLLSIKEDRVSSC